MVLTLLITQNFPSDYFYLLKIDILLTVAFNIAAHSHMFDPLSPWLSLGVNKKKLAV